MISHLATACRRRSLALLLGLAAAVGAAPLAAQGAQRIDPDSAIDADLAAPQPPANDRFGYDVPSYQDRSLDLPPEGSVPSYSNTQVAVNTTQPSYPAQTYAETPAATAQANTYHEDDLIGAAEGVFGKGAEGIAKLIRGILADQGEPNGYIVGREAGGAFIFGARYGSGTLFHKVEGQKPVYWTGPSIGFDAGANAGSTFVLVYNLYDTEELYERYPAGEGQAYFVGGLNASYLRKGSTVLIPIRVGAGLRLGINAGYMKFSKTQRWLPF